MSDDAESPSECPSAAPASQAPSGCSRVALDSNLAQRSDIAQRSDLILRSDLVLRSVAEGIVGIDRAGCIMFANEWAARAIGREVADLVGRDAHDIAPHLAADGSRCDGSRCELFDVFRGGDGTLAQEATFIDADGTPFPVEYSCVPATGDAGVEWAVFSFRNIAGRKRMQAELVDALAAAQRASRARSLFLSSMSHELRTPLTAIIGYAEMLIDDLRDAGEGSRVQDVERIRSSGRHLLGMIDSVLDIARIDAGRMAVAVDEFEVASLVGELEGRFRERMRERGNRFTVEGGAQAGRIVGDADKLRRILQNLLANANKFCENGEVALVVRRSAAAGSPVRVEFTVSDTGIGIAPEFVDQLFEPFAQADTTAARRFGGTGLGLALSSKLAQLLQGTIEVTSTPGAGSRFTVSVPVRYASPPAGVDRRGAGARR
ncbi:MAG TPA: PAS domain-containing sensor histidine kinase [Casimicrobiaceae bacterium]